MVPVLVLYFDIYFAIIMFDALMFKQQFDVVIFF